MKKTYTWGIAVGILLFAGCKPWSGTTPGCQQFLQGIQADWEYDEAKKVYVINPKDGRTQKDFIPAFLFDRKVCWEGMPAKKVRKLLGEPSKIEGARWSYFFWPTCHEKDGDCDYLLLVVDEKQGLKSAEYKRFELSH